MPAADLTTALAIGGLIVNAVGLLLITFSGGRALGRMQADIAWLKEHIARRRTTDNVSYLDSQTG